MNKADIKPAAWGAVGGAVALLIVIFSTGWVVTSSSARDMAEEMTEKAVVASLAPICVAQFSQGANGEAWLAELKALDYWKRADFVKAKGWATMPGSETPASDIADACAKQLVQLEN